MNKLHHAIPAYHGWLGQGVAFWKEDSLATTGFHALLSI
jgi:hypothetical protein